MKKIIIPLFVSLIIFIPYITNAAPFFKEKEVIFKIPNKNDDPIVKSKKINTHYRINKITATDVFYTKYVDGVLDANEENKKVALTNFDDNTKFKVVDVEYMPITVVWNSVTKKWSISNEIYFTKAEAAISLTDFIFAPVDVNGKPWVLKVDDAILVKKSKL